MSSFISGLLIDSSPEICDIFILELVFIDARRVATLVIGHPLLIWYSKLFELGIGHDDLLLMQWWYVRSTWVNCNVMQDCL